MRQERGDEILAEVYAETAGPIAEKQAELIKKRGDLIGRLKVLGTHLEKLMEERAEGVLTSENARQAIELVEITHDISVFLDKDKLNEEQLEACEKRLETLEAELMGPENIEHN